MDPPSQQPTNWNYKNKHLTYYQKEKKVAEIQTAGGNKVAVGDKLHTRNPKFSHCIFMLFITCLLKSIASLDPPVNPLLIYFVDFL